MANKGFLLVLMQPPSALEEEFNAWYDTEHIPERVAVRGFLSGIRYVCVSGAPKYLAMYDMENAGVVDTEDYMRVSFDRASPWTKRVTSRVRVYRSAGEQVYPGNAVTGPAARQVLLRFRGLPKSAEATIVAGMRANFEGRKDTLQVRVFAHDTGAGFDFLGLVAARAPLAEELDMDKFGLHASALDLYSSYAPY